MKRNNTKNLVSLTLVFIFLIGFYFRLIKFFNFSVLEADEGRDLLVTRHIVKYGEFITLGHTTAAIPGLSYSPYYYYLLSFFALIRDDPYFTFFMLTIIHTITILLIFLTGRNLFDENTGLLSSFSFSISSIMISFNNVWAAFTALPLFVLSLFFLSCFYKQRKKEKYIILHIFFFVLATSISYVFIYLAPLFIIWNILLAKNKQGLLVNSLKIILVWLTFLSFSFLPQMVFFKKKLVRIIFNRNLYTLSMPILSTNTHHSIKTFFDSYLTSSFFNPSISVAIYLLLSFIFLMDLVSRRKKIRKVNINLLMLFLGFNFGLIITSFKTGKIIPPHYLSGLFIFFIFIISFLINQITDKFQPRIIKAIVGGVLALSFFSPSQFLTHPDINQNSLKWVDFLTTKMVKVLNKMIKENKQIMSQFIIVQNSNVADPLFYPAPGFYYFLEKKVNKRLVKTIEGPQFNYISLNQNDYIFLVCRKYIQNTEHARANYSSCLNNFLRWTKVRWKKDYVLIEQFYHSNEMKGYLFKKRNR